jgi:hypothetical protein
MGDAALVGRKLVAVTAEIRRLADISGYGNFISDAACQQWAASIVSTVDDVEAAATVKVAEVEGVPVTGAVVDPTGA